MPKLGSRMTIAIMPTTTGGSMKGDTITVRTSPRAKLVRAMSKPSQVPSAICRTSEIA